MKFVVFCTVATERPYWLLNNEGSSRQIPPGVIDSPKDTPLIILRLARVLSPDRSGLRRNRKTFRPAPLRLQMVLSND